MSVKGKMQTLMAKNTDTFSLNCAAITIAIFISYFRSMKIDKSFFGEDEDNRQPDIDLLSKDIFQDERLMTEDQKESLFNDNLISTESNDNEHFQTMKVSFA